VANLNWPREDEVILWPLFSHYAFCICLAIQSPFRLAEDRQSGALELLLCTPLSPRAIVRGCMSGLARRFGGVFAATILFMIFNVYVYLKAHRPTSNFIHDDVFQLAMHALIVFPLQAYTFARLGLYQGLAQGNALRATFKLITKVGLLPWGLCIATLLALEELRKHFKFVPSLKDEMVFGAWTASHVLLCVMFLAHANWQMKHRFRLIASESSKRRWWAALWKRAKGKREEMV
jgi:hypothetical protein